METASLLSPCPACGKAALVKTRQVYQCQTCGLAIKEKKALPWFWRPAGAVCGRGYWS
jgi:predicted RNA-binding Zn-ribbon protein involved in translation (DUF1610 family)